MKLSPKSQQKFIMYRTYSHHDHDIDDLDGEFWPVMGILLAVWGVWTGAIHLIDWLTFDAVVHLDVAGVGARLRATVNLREIKGQQPVQVLPLAAATWATVRGKVVRQHTTTSGPTAVQHHPVLL